MQLVPFAFIVFLGVLVVGKGAVAETPSQPSTRSEMTIIVEVIRDSPNATVDEIMRAIEAELPQSRMTINMISSRREMILGSFEAPEWFLDLLVEHNTGRPTSRSTLVSSVLAIAPSSDARFRSKTAIIRTAEVWLTHCIRPRTLFPHRSFCTRHELTNNNIVWRLSDFAKEQYLEQLLMDEAERLRPPVRPPKRQRLELDDVASQITWESNKAVILEHLIETPDLPLEMLAERLPVRVPIGHLTQAREELRNHTRQPLWFHSFLVRYKGELSASNEALVNEIVGSAPGDAYSHPQYVRDALAVWLPLCFDPLPPKNASSPCVARLDVFGMSSVFAVTWALKKHYTRIRPQLHAKIHRLRELSAAEPAATRQAVEASPAAVPAPQRSGRQAALALLNSGNAQDWIDMWDEYTVDTTPFTAAGVH